jgi:uncharacterized protein YciI
MERAMPYIAVCDDDPTVDAAALRRSAKADHFAYIEGILDRLLVAGPLVGPDDGGHCASVFVYAVDTEAAARELLENDPYFRAGIYARVRLAPFVPAAGRWLGGTTW